MSALPDEFYNSTTVNGKTTVTFPSRPYHRRITNVYVNHPTGGTVTFYRGNLTSPPVTSNQLGQDQNVRGSIKLPAGQQFFVVWANLASPTNGAFARLSAERVDSPLDDAIGDVIDWDTNPISQLILPTGHSTTSGAVIFLDGVTGTITVIGTGGGKIVIDPNAVSPQLHFFSADGTNDAFINAVSSGSNVDLGLNSGVFTPADGVARRGRLFFADSSDIVDLGVINSATQNRQGGWLRTTAESAFTGYDDATLPGGPFHAYFIYDKTGTILQIQNGAVTKEFHFNTSQALFDGDFVLHESGAVFMRVADIINPLHFQADQRCNSGTTITSTTPATLPGCSISFITSIATAKFSVQMTCDMSINVANSVGIGQLFVDGVAQQGQAIYSAGVGNRATVTQTFEGTVSGVGSHSFALEASVAVAAQSVTFNAIHTKMGIRIYE